MHNNMVILTNHHWFLSQTQTAENRSKDLFHLRAHDLTTHTLLPQKSTVYNYTYIYSDITTLFSHNVLIKHCLNAWLVNLHTSTNVLVKHWTLGLSPCTQSTHHEYPHTCAHHFIPIYTGYVITHPMVFHFLASESQELKVKERSHVSRQGKFCA